MKILIIRFSSIGDIVLTSPVIRCLKKQNPDFRIHYATKHKFRTLLEHNQYIDKLHLLDERKVFINELKAEKFDMIIDLHNNMRTFLLWTSLRVKRHTVDKLNWEKWLMVRFKINILPYVHIVDRYLETTHELKVRNDDEGLDFFIDKNAKLDIPELPANYVVYAIGGQHFTKKLPLEKQIELLKTIKEPVYLIGGAEDAERGNEIAEMSHAKNYCGRLNIHQSALLIQGSAKVYTHDTGMMHIAAALRKPIVSIWGNTIPEFGMTPYYPKSFDRKQHVIKEVNDLDCRPCSKIGFNKCPLGHFACMELQDFQG